MSPVSYQTIKLSKGKHSNPEDGACVMELASMLAGEQFTDHPVAVCPVIGSFLRAYNDSIDDSRRQALYEFASKVVGSRAGAHVQEVRAARLAEWAEEMRQSRRGWVRFISPLHTIRRMRKPPIDAIGTYAVHSIPRHTDQTHAAVLALVDELLGIARGEDWASGRVIGAPGRTLDAAV